VGRVIRAVAATVILVMIAIAAVVGTAPAREPGATEILPPPPAGPTSSSTSTQPEPEEPFVYRIGVLSGPTTDNYWKFHGSGSSVWDAYILGPTKPALYQVRASDATLQPELGTVLAEPVEEENGWYVLVGLDPDLAWSDGRPITAVDVVFTFETARRLDLGGAWETSFPEGVVSVSAEASHLVRIAFSGRPPISVWPHAIGTAPIMPAHVWGDIVAGLETADELYALDGGGDVAGGPLAIEAVTDTLVVSVANPGYTLASTPDRVEYHVFDEEADAATALASGEIDVILTPRGVDIRHYQDVPSEVALVDSPSNGIRYLGFNLEREPMSSPAFRRVLALLLPRQLDSYITAANSAWHDPARAEAIAAPYLAPMEERISSAMEMLRDAGYSWESEPADWPDGASGAGLTIAGEPPRALTILTPGEMWDPLRPAHAGQVADLLRWLGFDVLVLETDFDTVVDLTFRVGEDGTHGYDLYLLGWSLGDPSLPGFHRLFFAADGMMNNTGYMSASFGEALASYERATTHADARSALWEMEEILASDLPYLLLYGAAITEAYRTDRVGYEPGIAIGGIQARLGGITDVRRVAPR
jgi:peptide/nickel transport system substrate-binding protein